MLTALRRIQGGGNVMLGIPTSWGFVYAVMNLGLYNRLIILGADIPLCLVKVKVKQFVTGPVLPRGFQEV